MWQISNFCEIHSLSYEASKFFAMLSLCVFFGRYFAPGANIVPPIAYKSHSTPFPIRPHVLTPHSWLCDKNCGRSSAPKKSGIWKWRITLRLPCHIWQAPLITTRYNQDLQNTISEHTTHRTLKQMGSSSRRPHRSRSCQIRTAHGGYNSHRLTKTRQQKIVKRCLVWWVSISAATFRCRVRIWCKEHESMDHPALSQRFSLVLGV